MGSHHYGAHLVPSSTSHSVAALLVVVWGASIFALVPESTKGASIVLYVLQGVVLTAAAVTLVSLQQERLGPSAPLPHRGSLALAAAAGSPIRWRAVHAPD